MSEGKTLEYWTIWYPKAAATGLLIGRGLIDPTDRLILHAAPDFITVEVTDQQGKRLAFGKDLKKKGDSPMCLLSKHDGQIVREDIWPTEELYGAPVLLPGGEVGILQEWWNAGDQKEWRWKVVFYNSLR